MILNEFFNLPQVFEKDMAEDTGQDSKSWMASIRQQHPDVKFIQAKMPGAPIIALVNGKPVAQFDTKKDVGEGTEETPFGSVSHNDTPVKPQQYHYGTEPSDKEIRKQRLLNVRQRKQDLLRDYAQMGALRVELIHGINNDVFLNKDQLLDYFDHLVDDPELTPLEYAHENGIPTDGLLKGMLRRAAQLGVSALDVRKLFASAKAKQGVSEGEPGDLEHELEKQDYQRRQQRDSDAEKALNKKDQDVDEGMFGSRPSPVLPIVAKIDRVARELTPQNVETGKQIIQSHTRDITRMLSPQAKAGVDVIEQGVAEAKDDYVPPKEANYDDKYQAMVRRVGEKARAQEKAKQQQPNAPVRESRLALLKQIIQS